MRRETIYELLRRQLDLDRDYYRSSIPAYPIQLDLHVFLVADPLELTLMDPSVAVG